MSEGINFSDGLARYSPFLLCPLPFPISLLKCLVRCVVVVGLPYPNPSDPFLKEKMEFIKSSTTSSISSGDYYDNLCMQAVNQSIGSNHPCPSPILPPSLLPPPSIASSPTPCHPVSHAGSVLSDKCIGRSVHQARQRLRNHCSH